MLASVDQESQPKKKKKLAQQFKTWTKTNGKISFGLDRKSPKFEKYTNFKSFKPHLIHRTVYVIAKMRCGAVMVLAKF